jgi:hypothetical protein
VNADLLSLVVIGGSGSAMLAGIAAHEYAQAERMRASRVRLSVRYPMNLEPSQVTAAWDGLAGLSYTTELVAEVLATEGSITHSLLVPQAACESVRATLTGVSSRVCVWRTPHRRPARPPAWACDCSSPQASSRQITLCRLPARC